MRPIQRVSLGIIGLGIVLLVIGFLSKSDLLGFFFMVCLIGGAGLFVYDLVAQRRKGL